MENPKPTRKVRGRPKGSGTQNVYDGLRNDILRLQLLPGTNIEETPLEKRFKVSRTPVREALIRLASEGLITLLPNRGARVAEMDYSDVPPFFESLSVCQRLILRLSALRRTDEQLEELRIINEKFTKAAKELDVVAMSELNSQYHATTGKACGNKFISEFYNNLMLIGLRLARSAFGSALEDPEFLESYYAEVVDHHNAIIDALARRDANAAETLGSKHTELFRSRIIRALKTNQSMDLDLSEITQ